MNTCKQAKSLIDQYLAGEITLRNLNLLQQHVASCEYCRALLEIHFEVTNEDESIPMASDSQLDTMRAKVMHQLAVHEQREKRAAPPANSIPNSNTGNNTSSDTSTETHLDSHTATVHTLPRLPKTWRYGFATAAMLMVAVLVGRWSVTIDLDPLTNQLAGPGVLQDEGLLNNQALIDQLTRYASLQRAGQNLRDDYWDTPLTYANVSFGQLSGNTLELGFDVCRRVDMTAAADSAIAKEVLLHAILNPTNLGGQFKAMRVAATTLDQRLVEALILTLHNDDALPVRIEAFTILSRLPKTDTIEKAFLATLQQDQAVKMRLMALKQLSQDDKLGTDFLLETIQSGSQDNSAALIQALQQKRNNSRRQAKDA